MQCLNLTEKETQCKTLKHIYAIFAVWFVFYNYTESFYYLISVIKEEIIPYV